ncbi:hypothetical protein A2U01_0090115 [Trifolium medium]|uniref:Uncharacterized protein n=1 Tax=Trifolium medium TaxID=97028 RepID=A0A392U7T8_9FABA|nr:hypothetical protein [Trifolium medium]
MVVNAGATAAGTVVHGDGRRFMTELRPPARQRAVELRR